MSLNLIEKKTRWKKCTFYLQLWKETPKPRPNRHSPPTEHAHEPFVFRLFLLQFSQQNDKKRSKLIERAEKQQKKLGWQCHANTQYIIPSIILNEIMGDRSHTAVCRTQTRAYLQTRFRYFHQFVTIQTGHCR